MDDLYNFIGRCRPTNSRPFVLQTIFPTRVLEKGDSTIEQEGLKGGTVVMRWQ
jgi:UBX domain